MYDYVYEDLCVIARPVQKHDCVTCGRSSLISCVVRQAEHLQCVGAAMTDEYM